VIALDDRKLEMAVVWSGRYFLPNWLVVHRINLAAAGVACTFRLPLRMDCSSANFYKQFTIEPRRFGSLTCVNFSAASLAEPGFFHCSTIEARQPAGMPVVRVDRTVNPKVTGAIAHRGGTSRARSSPYFPSHCTG
jgi:hypothetical protein